MQVRTKIRFDAVEKARKLLESVPAHEREEMTKSHAIRLLIPQIRDAQSKGYSIEAIAKMLCESGVQVSAHLIKDLVWKVGARRESERGGVDKPPRRRTPAAREGDAAARQEASAHEASTKPLANKAVTATSGRSGHEVPTGESLPRGQSPASTGTSPPRRSTFVPRPDTKDI